MRWIKLHEKDGTEHFVNLENIADIARWKIDNETTICRLDGTFFECIEDYETVLRAIWFGSRSETCNIEIDGKKIKMSYQNMRDCLTWEW
jgi:hypothetical protein